MRASKENANAANNSTSTSRVAHETRPTNPDHTLSVDHPLLKCTNKELIAQLTAQQSAVQRCCQYPNGLIGQKVVFTPVKEDRKSKVKYHPSDNYPLPERGYFIISSARLSAGCGKSNVLVDLDGGYGYPSYQWGISSGWLTPYVENSLETTKNLRT